MRLISLTEKGISDCFIIWKREMENICKDFGVVLLFLVVPVVYPVLYGLIYNTETIHEVALIVVDESHSSSAREFVRKIDASSEVHVLAYASSMEEARERVNRKEAYAILLIPSDFSRKINRGEQAVAALYSDMTSMLFYQAVLLAATEASLDSGNKIHVERKQNPVLQEYVPFYNPQKGFASFLLPAILMLVIQQTLLLGISMLGATVRERNQGRLIPEKDMFIGTVRMVLRKAMAYLALYVFVCLWALVIVPYLFAIPRLMHFNALILFILPYLLACVFFAMTIGGFIRGRETPMMILIFTSLIFLFMSGVSWPLSAVPDFWRYISCLVPSTFGIQGFVKLNTMGASLEEIAFEYRMLWLQTAVYFVFTCLVYRYEIVRVFKKVE